MKSSNSAGVTNARKVHRRETNFPITSQILHGLLPWCLSFILLFTYEGILHVQFWNVEFANQNLCWKCWRRKGSGRVEGEEGGNFSETTQLLSIDLASLVAPTFLPFDFLASKVDSISSPIISFNIWQSTKHPSPKLVGNWTPAKIEDHNVCDDESHIWLLYLPVRMMMTMEMLETMMMLPMLHGSTQG